MQIDKAITPTFRLWATYTNNYGQAANPDTSTKVAIYPANSNTPAQVLTDMTNFTTGIFYYVVNSAVLSTGPYTVRYQFIDEGVTQELTDQIDITDSTSLNTTLTNINAALATLAGSGSGIINETLRFKDSTRKNLPGLLVWLTTDALGNTTFTSKDLRTNSAGQITFRINANTTYYVWTEKSSAYVQTIFKQS